MLGSSLVPYLRNLGHQTICLSREVGDIGTEVVDYSSESSLETVLDSYRPDCIINLAALTDVDLCEKDPQLAYSSNVKIVEFLSRWMKSNIGSNLIQISTDHIYDGPGPHVEGNVNLVNYYAFSKFSGELAASSVPSTILRTNFFGKSQSSTRKSFSDWAFDSLVRQERINVFSDVLFSPLSINSLVEYIKLVIQKPIVGTFNLGSKDGFSKAEFVFTLAESLGLSTKNISRTSLDKVGLTALRPRDMRMDCSKFEKLFDVKLPTLAEEITISMGDYYEKT